MYQTHVCFLVRCSGRYKWELSRFNSRNVWFWVLHSSPRHSYQAKESNFSPFLITTMCLCKLLQPQIKQKIHREREEITTSFWNNYPTWLIYRSAPIPSGGGATAEEEEGKWNGGGSGASSERTDTLWRSVRGILYSVQSRA